MAPDVDRLVNSVLEDYSRVEPQRGSVARWMAQSAGDARPSGRFLWLPAPAWAAIAFVLLVLLGLSWYRPGAFSRQPRLAGEQTSLRAVAPGSSLTAQQKQLLHLLATDPAALAKLPPASAPRPH
ncbi:MAG: hypothetical protein ACRD1Y_02395 [Terriglobales bacterium]